MTDELGPRQRAAQTKRLRTREALVMAAIDLATEAGDLHRVEDIAEAAGVSLATLYNHFDTKKQLIDAAYERLMSPVTEPIIRAAESDAYNPPDRVAELRRYVEDVASLACDHRALTAELMRAWIEEQHGGSEHDLIAPRLVVAIAVITSPLVERPAPRPRIHFPGDVEFPGGLVRGSWSTPAYHMNALLMHACESRSSSDDVALHVLDQLIPSIMHAKTALEQAHGSPEPHR